MNRETSIYLDLVRFSASIVVFIGHLSGSRFSGGLLWQFGLFMDDAVMVFFVLSGFVIAYVAHHKEEGLEKYAVARAARIYSVALPALVLTFILDAIGREISPELYFFDWGYSSDNLIGQFFAGLFFLNQLWYVPIGTGSMLPYWSLGFEVWYYIFFAIIFFAQSHRKILFFLAACAIAGPRIVAFFPIWMLGYLGYLYSSRNKPGRTVGFLLLILPVLGYVFYHLALKKWLMENPFLPNAVGSDNFMPRYIVGILFAMHLVGFVWTAECFSAVFKPLQTPIRWLAGATFTIYLFHVPVAQFLTTIIPWAPSDWRTRVIVLGGTLTLMFVIAQFTERKKEVWNWWIAGIYRKIQTS
jgi:peptidoglycan/LPS O-acetylase OafA/YrhL